MYWATDLLPEEFDFSLASRPRTTQICYIGSLGGSEHPLYQFIEDARQRSKDVILIDPWRNPVSFEKGMELMINSYCAPDFRSHGSQDHVRKHGLMNGSNHLDIGYVPCRVLKAISYGQTGITNSKRVKAILGDYVEYCENARDVIPTAAKRMNDVEWRIECMKHVQNRHTYIHRTRDIARALLCKRPTLN